MREAVDGEPGYQNIFDGIVALRFWKDRKLWETRYMDI